MSDTQQNTGFVPISPERAKEIKEALQRSRSVSQGLSINSETGQIDGISPIDGNEKKNLIGKFDTHFGTKYVIT